MKNVLVALVVVLLLSSTACAGWYVGPRAVYAYYPPVGPVYVQPAPVVVAHPYVTYAPVVPAPVVVPAPAWIGPPVIGISPRVYIYGQPVRNVVRAVVP